MATPQTFNTTQTDIQNSASRLVWVLNRDTFPYKGKFRGTEINIPANMEKIPKRVEHGGNLMAYLEARRFITEYKDPQGFHEDENGDRHPIFRLKALMDVELTPDEVRTIVGKTPEEMRKEAVKEAATLERAAKRNLTKELNKRVNKISLEDKDEE